MLQTYAAEHQPAHGDHDGGLNVSRYLGILKKRILYLLIPFVLVLVGGSALTAIQRPIYRAEGKILIESQEIPADLVRPTVTSAASERIQVIQQRIMTRDNLLGIVNKYGLFPREQKWMSASQLLDLMRDRTEIKLIDSTSASQRTINTIAFTLGFEYESPDIATKVANEFVTLILNEDARTRTNRAVETTKFLAREVARLQGELGASEAQITAAKQRKLDNDRQQLQSGVISATGLGGNSLAQQLMSLKAELLQKAAVYSSEHPAVRALKLRIAALEKTVAESPPTPEPVNATPSDDLDKFGIDALEKQRGTIERSLDDANKKLTAAQLGESLERDQQSERLEVIEQPTAPQKPVRPNRMKLLALTLVAAMMAGAGSIFTIESIDRTIRGPQELYGVFDSSMIVAIPYIATSNEGSRRRRRQIFFISLLIIVPSAALAAAFYFDLIPTDLSWVDESWLDRLRSLAK